MHSAPAVSYPVGRSRFEAWVSALAWLAGAVICGFWLLQSSSWGWRQGLAMALVLGTGAAAASAWYFCVSAVLRWDGQAWWRETSQASQSGKLAVHLDFQSCLLLSLRTDTDERYWFWLERRGAPAAWNALRRAACSRADQSSQQNAETPSSFGEARS
jgi:toxin CptA